MSDIVERVAEAIWRADHRANMPESWVACAYPNYYGTLARAAVDALQLTEEWAAKNPYSGGVIEVPENSEENARKMKAIIPDTDVLSRLVSPWLAEEGQ